jgi:hypothetical protein
MNKAQKKKRDFESLVLALRLAITAPTKEEAEQCINLLRGFDLSDLDKAKGAALRQIEGQEGRKIFNRGGPSSHASD